MSRKRGLWDGLGDTLFTKDDKEDFKSLRGAELDRVEGTSNPATSDTPQRHEPGRAAEDEGIVAQQQRWTGSKSNDHDAKDKGILKTVSLQVR